MAYDTWRGVTVVFGGVTLGTGGLLGGDTWEWDGTMWRHRAVPGPSARTLTQMVFDCARGVTVLFGGVSISSQYYGDTWEWDGTTWTQRALSGPSARIGHAMAYDAHRGVTVLFGGGDGVNFLGETWEWDGVVWTQRLVTEPSRRISSTMAYDVARRVTVLFGGGMLSNIYRELWEWDGTRWTNRTPVLGGPSARTGHAMTYDVTRAKTIVAGDFGFSVADTWEWDGIAWTRQQNLPGRWGHALAYDVGRGVTVCFGGVLSAAYITAELWEWNGTSWVQRSAGGPSDRDYPAMAYDTSRGVTVLYGGYSAGAVTPELGDTWEWNGSAWTKPSVGQSPGIRAGHAMSYDSRRGVTVLCGGVSGSTSAMDTWEWNGGAWVSRGGGGPPFQRGHAMSYDVTRGVTVLFGGTNPNNPSRGVTWEWDGSNLAAVSGSGPSARSEHAMAYDTSRGVTVLFGGLGAGGETWEWSGTVWNQRATAGPAARHGHAMAYNDRRGVTVLLGGLLNSNNATSNETWEWNGVSWVQQSVSALQFGHHAMAHDSARNETLAFRAFSDAWVPWGYGASRPPAPASFGAFGQGCAGSRGVPLPRLAPGPLQIPRLGSVLRVELRNLPTTGTEFILLGSSRTTWAGRSLPLDLSVIGMPSCALHVEPLIWLPATRTGGISTVLLQIPPTPSLVGRMFYGQGFVLDASANSLGAIMSNAGGWRVRGP